MTGFDFANEPRLPGLVPDVPGDVNARPRCDAPTTVPGHLCAITFGLRNGRCLVHDPVRAPAARAARVLGGVRGAAVRHAQKRGDPIASVHTHLARIELALERIDRRLRELAHRRT